jgi:hypothetical protein
MNQNIQAITAVISSDLEFNDDILLQYISKFVGYSEQNKSENALPNFTVIKKVIRLLVNKFGSELLNRQINGEYPITCAAKVNKKLFEFLIEEGANLDVHNSKGYYPIHISVTNKKPDNIEIILKRYPQQINKQSMGQMKTPLMLAISSFDAKITDILISFKPNETLTDIFGNTALHYALIKLNMYILPKITFHNKENYFRMTPSDYIKNNMKAYFHVVRNNKVNSIEPSKLSFLVEIYKKYVSTKNETKREFATHKNIVAVNKYILNSIPDGISSIPDELII